MVMAELAGRFEAPLYGMLEVDNRINAHDWGGLTRPTIGLHGQPADESRPALLWDGEWEITWVTFRDMGAAFGAAILGIYVLVVAQFRSFRLPLVILTPIPLTLIGILIGHWLLGAPFTATSMIGFIALAGAGLWWSLQARPSGLFSRQGIASLPSYSTERPILETSSVPGYTWQPVAAKPRGLMSCGTATWRTTRSGS